MDDSGSGGKVRLAPQLTWQPRAPLPLPVPGSRPGTLHARPPPAAAAIAASRQQAGGEGLLDHKRSRQRDDAAPPLLPSTHQGCQDGQQVEAQGGSRQPGAARPPSERSQHDRQGLQTIAAASSADSSPPQKQPQQQQRRQPSHRRLFPPLPATSQVQPAAPRQPGNERWSAFIAAPDAEEGSCGRGQQQATAPAGQLQRRRGQRGGRRSERSPRMQGVAGAAGTEALSLAGQQPLNSCWRAQAEPEAASPAGGGAEQQASSAPAAEAAAVAEEQHAPALGQERQQPFAAALPPSDTFSIASNSSIASGSRTQPWGSTQLEPAAASSQTARWSAFFVPEGADAGSSAASASAATPQPAARQQQLTLLPPRMLQSQGKPGSRGGRWQQQQQHPLPRAQLAADSSAEQGHCSQPNSAPYFLPAQLPPGWGRQQQQAPPSPPPPPPRPPSPPPAQRQDTPIMTGRPQPQLIPEQQQPQPAWLPGSLPPSERAAAAGAAAAASASRQDGQQSLEELGAGDAAAGAQAVAEPAPEAAAAAQPPSQGQPPGTLLMSLEQLADTLASSALVQWEELLAAPGAAELLPAQSVPAQPAPMREGSQQQGQPLPRPHPLLPPPQPPPQQQQGQEQQEGNLAAAEEGDDSWAPPDSPAIASADSQEGQQAGGESPLAEGSLLDAPDSWEDLPAAAGSASETNPTSSEQHAGQVLPVLAQPASIGGSTHMAQAPQAAAPEAALPVAAAPEEAGPVAAAAAAAAPAAVSVAAPAEPTAVAPAPAPTAEAAASAGAPLPAAPAPAPAGSPRCQPSRQRRVQLRLLTSLPASARGDEQQRQQAAPASWAALAAAAGREEQVPRQEQTQQAQHAWGPAAAIPAAPPLLSQRALPPMLPDAAGQGSLPEASAADAPAAAAAATATSDSWVPGSPLISVHEEDEQQQLGGQACSAGPSATPDSWEALDQQPMRPTLLPGAARLAPLTAGDSWAEERAPGRGGTAAGAINSGSSCGLGRSSAQAPAAVAGSLGAVAGEAAAATAGGGLLGPAAPLQEGSSMGSSMEDGDLHNLLQFLLPAPSSDSGPRRAARPAAYRPLAAAPLQAPPPAPSQGPPAASQLPTPLPLPLPVPLSGQRPQVAPAAAPADPAECCMCLEAEPAAVCVPCGHRVLCAGCVPVYLDFCASRNRGDCPICRAVLVGCQLPGGRMLACA